MKILLFFSVFLLGTNERKEVVYNEKLASKAEISYSKSYKLQWKDFIVIQKSNDFAAVSSTGFSYNYETDGDYIKIEVNCQFYKPHSFVVEKHRNDYILNHEQRHFDISYIYSQKFIQELRNQKNLDFKKMDYIYEKIWQESQNYQDKYDSETKHSILKDKQEEWNKIIDNQLSTIK
jgi:hypothetical protein